MKKCSKCEIEKPLDCFGKQKGGLYGLRSACFECRRIEQKKYFEKKRDIINKKQRDRYEKNIIKERERNKIWRDSNKEKIKQYRVENLEKIKKTHSNWYKKNKESHLKKMKKYHEVNKEKMNQNSKKYYEDNKERLIELHKKYYYNRLKTDPIFKFKCAIKSNIYLSFKRGKNQFQKNARTEQILGCTIEEFRSYIESKFKKGMSFENHGEWHLDHITPIAIANTEEEIIKLNHYTNFQPLWAEENIRKGARLDY